MFFSIRCQLNIKQTTKTNNFRNEGLITLKNSIYKKFIQFLQDDLALPKESLSIVQKAVENNIEPVPMILWQYGLVTLEELDRIYDWLETV